MTLVRPNISCVHSSVTEELKEWWLDTELECDEKDWGRDDLFIVKPEEQTLNSQKATHIFDIWKNTLAVMLVRMILQRY